MSREIDTSDPDSLSEEDILYLADRDQLPEGVDNPRVAELDKQLDTAQEMGSDDEFSDYEDQTVTELQEELKTRGLSTSGNKAELIARLEQDDQK